MRQWTAALIPVLGLCFAGGPPAYGQEFLRHEVFGSFGTGAWTSRDYNAGRATGSAGGGGFEYRWSRRFGLRADYNFWRASGPTHVTSPGSSGTTTLATEFSATGGMASVSFVRHWG